MKIYNKKKSENQEKSKHKQKIKGKFMKEISKIAEAKCVLCF